MEILVSLAIPHLSISTFPREPVCQLVQQAFMETSRSNVLPALRQWNALSAFTTILHLRFNVHHVLIL